VALFGKLPLQAEIVFDNAVVHEHDLARAVAMRVRKCQFSLPSPAWHPLRIAFLLAFCFY
jgi:hypothetical protein